MRFSFDPIGTIGNMPCEISLNKILADINDPHLVRKTMRLLQVTKFRIKQLENISDKSTQSHFRILLIRECAQSVMKITGKPISGKEPIDPLTSHIMCCLHAYFNIKKEQK